MAIIETASRTSKALKIFFYSIMVLRFCNKNAKMSGFGIFSLPVWLRCKEPCACLAINDNTGKKLLVCKCSVTLILSCKCGIISNSGLL